MDVNTFADWVLVILGATLCLLGIAVVGYSILVQIKDKEAFKDFRWTPIVLGGFLMWFGATMVGNFDNLSSEDADEPAQVGTR